MWMLHDLFHPPPIQPRPHCIPRPSQRTPPSTSFLMKENGEIVCTSAVHNNYSNMRGGRSTAPGKRASKVPISWNTTCTASSSTIRIHQKRKWDSTESQRPHKRAREDIDSSDDESSEAPTKKLLLQREEAQTPFEGEIYEDESVPCAKTSYVTALSTLPDDITPNTDTPGSRLQIEEGYEVHIDAHAALLEKKLCALEINIERLSNDFSVAEKKHKEAQRREREHRVNKIDYIQRHGGSLAKWNRRWRERRATLEKSERAMEQIANKANKSRVFLDYEKEGS